jgi:hypothetical protein
MGHERRRSAHRGDNVSLFLISNDREKSLKIGKLFLVSEEFEEEEANGVIGMTFHRGIG